MLVPKLLSKMFLVISFHWSLRRLIHFQVMLTEFLYYRNFIELDIAVVSNRPKALIEYLKTIEAENIHVVPFEMAKNSSQHNPLALLYEYRKVVEEYYKKDNYTTFMYIEDDTLVPWSAMVSWAIDTTMLEPLGFHRGIYRVEINRSGKTSLMESLTNLAQRFGCDMKVTANYSNPNNPLNSANMVDVMNFSTQSLQSYNSAIQTFSDQCSPPKSHFFTAYNLKTAQKTVPCPIHRYFVQLVNPYQGLWIFTRAQLEKIMQHPYWSSDPEDLLRVETRRVHFKYGELGYMERSNSIFFYIDPPKHFHVTLLVPFTIEEDNKPLLSKYARVDHLTNRYDVDCSVEESLVF